MTLDVSDNTKAILLLTAPLLVGRGKSADNPLTLSEYNKLARRLSEVGSEPADLLNTGSEEILSEWQSGFASSRIDRLLERGFLLSQAIEQWQARAIWTVSRADDAYPERLKKRLGMNAPTVLYGCGDLSLLERDGLAVVGSRKISDELMEYTVGIGKMAARAGYAIVSGAAKGVDRAAIDGARTVGGIVAGILTGDLETEALNPEHREELMNGQQVLISSYDPRAGFNVGNAMRRNKLIYALANAGLVIESGNGEGGTWAGAVEQLDKLHLAPVYTRSEGEIGPGLQALQRKGAIPWPNPETPDEFRAVLTGDHTSSTTVLPGRSLQLFSDDDAPLEPGRDSDSTSNVKTTPPVISVEAQESSPADTLFAVFEKLVEDMGSPVKVSDVSECLHVDRKQAMAWLERLVSEGKYTRQKRPITYVRTSRIL